MTSVADELALDALLDKMSPMERASFERAAKSRYVDRGLYNEGYDHGWNAGIREGRQRAKADAEKAVVDAATTEPPATPPT